MPANLELLQGLREGYDTLSYQDEDKLSELSNRGRAGSPASEKSTYTLSVKQPA